MSVAGLVDDPAVVSFDDEKIPGAQEILTRARGGEDRSIGNEGADADFSRSPLVAEVVAEPSVAHTIPLRDVATVLIPVSLGDHCLWYGRSC